MNHLQDCFSFLDRSRFCHLCQNPCRSVLLGQNARSNLNDWNHADLDKTVCGLCSDVLEAAEDAPLRPKLCSNAAASASWRYRRNEERQPDLLTDCQLLQASRACSSTVFCYFFSITYGPFCATDSSRWLAIWNRVMMQGLK